MFFVYGTFSNGVVLINGNILELAFLRICRVHIVLNVCVWIMRIIVLSIRVLS